MVSFGLLFYSISLAGSLSNTSENIPKIKEINSLIDVDYKKYSLNFFFLSFVNPQKLQDDILLNNWNLILRAQGCFTKQIVLNHFHCGTYKPSNLALIGWLVGWLVGVG